MNYGSVCSGIEAVTVAWHSLGWKPEWFSEIEKFPSRVLAHHYPDVPNLGDMTKIAALIQQEVVGAPDVLVGGTPCQAFSVAGLRNSLNDDRGQLSLEFVRLANEIDSARLIRGLKPSIVVWENVPGVLNTSDNAFGCFLGALSGEGCELQPAGKKWPNAGCVYGPQRQIAWRVLDAQYFGVAQRRRRVFVVASAREGFNPAEVLFESEGVRRDIAPSRSARQETAGSVAQGFASSSFAQYRPVIGDGATIKASGGDLGGGSENLVVLDRDDYASNNRVGKCLTRGAAQRYDFETEDLIIHPLVVHGTQDPITSDVAFPVGRNQGQENAIALAGNTIGRQPHNGGNGNGFDASGVCYTLTATDRHGVCYARAQNITVSKKLIVRRLTPIECERLQGFPDNHTQIPYRNKPAEDCPDGPRYAALGNSMAVPVMKWIGERIQEVCGV